MDSEHGEQLASLLYDEQEIDWDFSNAEVNDPLDVGKLKPLVTNIVFHNIPQKAVIRCCEIKPNSPSAKNNDEAKNYSDGTGTIGSENASLRLSDLDDIEDEKFHEEINLDSDDCIDISNSPDKTTVEQDMEGADNEVEVFQINEEENDNEDGPVQRREVVNMVEQSEEIETIIRTMADIRKEFNIRFVDDDIVAETGSPNVNSTDEQYEVSGGDRIVVIRSNGILIKSNQVIEEVTIDEDEGEPVHIDSTTNGLTDKEDNRNSAWTAARTTTPHLIELISDDEIDGSEPRYYMGKEMPRREKLRYLCEKCGLCFMLSSSLKRHRYKEHNIKDGGDFECQICDKIFVESKELHMHITTVHAGGGEETFRYRKPSPPIEQCESLEVSYKINGEEYVCYLCKRGFSMKSNEIVRSENETEECILCGRKYITIGLLRKLVRTQNGMRRKYKCNICGKQYMACYNLTLHMNMKHNINVTTAQLASNCDAERHKYSKLVADLKIREKTGCDATQPTMKRYNCQEPVCGRHKRKRKAMYERRLSFSRECKNREPQGFSSSSRAPSMGKQDWSRMNGRLYCCKICKKEFKYSKELMLHLSVHSKT